MGWKYVMFELAMNSRDDSVKFKFPVIFPDKMVHRQVAECLMPLMRMHGQGGARVVSAGSIEHLEADGLGGESETLGIESDPDDEATINGYSYFHGVAT